MKTLIILSLLLLFLLSTREHFILFSSPQHQAYCEGTNPNFNSPVTTTVTTVTFPIQYVFQEAFDPRVLEAKASAESKILEASTPLMLEDSELQVNLVSTNFNTGFDKVFGYPLMEIDSEWLKQNISYMAKLPLQDKFTIFGYTFQGNNLINLRIKHGYGPEFRKYLTNTVLNPAMEDRYNRFYFPLFMQTIKKIVSYFQSGKIRGAVHSKDSIKEIQKIFTNSSVIAYSLINKARTLFTYEFWCSVVDDFIDDLERIIKNSPPTTKQMILYRGEKKDYQAGKTPGDVYINNLFMSTSFDPNVAFLGDFTDRASQCCVQKIILAPGSKCLFVESITQYRGENEILLPPGNKFKIKEMFMAKFNALDLGSSQQGYESTLCDLDEFEMKVKVVETL
jgi:hypothetical protein